MANRAMGLENARSGGDIFRGRVRIHDRLLRPQSRGHKGNEKGSDPMHWLPRFDAERIRRHPADVGGEEMRRWTERLSAHGSKAAHSARI
jgi:hypothetical protein